MTEELLVGVLVFAGVVITALSGLLVRERRRNGNPGNPNGLRELKREMHERFDETQKTQTDILRELTQIKTIIDERLPRR